MSFFSLITMWWVMEGPASPPWHSTLWKEGAYPHLVVLLPCHRPSISKSILCWHSNNLASSTVNATYHLASVIDCSSDFPYSPPPSPPSSLAHADRRICETCTFLRASVDGQSNRTRDLVLWTKFTEIHFFSGSVYPVNQHLHQQLINIFIINNSTRSPSSDPLWPKAGGEI